MLVYQRVSHFFSNVFVQPPFSSILSWATALTAPRWPTRPKNPKVAAAPQFYDQQREARSRGQNLPMGTRVLLDIWDGFLHGYVSFLLPSGYLT
jgi:hypothetical protein